MTYFACFDQTTVECRHARCFNGWIANYTTVNGLFEGYPNNPVDSPVFRLNINSAADYYIRKASNLKEDFDRLIDIVCSQFDPTVTTPRAPSQSSSLLYNSQASTNQQ